MQRLDDTLARARARAVNPEDGEMRRAAHLFVVEHFGGCHSRAAAFFDEFAAMARGD